MIISGIYSTTCVNVFIINIVSIVCVCPLLSDSQHLSDDVCLEVVGEIIITVCVVLCTEVVHSHKHT